MMQFDDKFIDDLLKDCSRSLVGRLCKQIELLQDKEIDYVVTKLDLVKSFNKNLVYEVFRELKNNLICYQQGKKSISFKIYTPKQDKSV